MFLHQHPSSSSCPEGGRVVDLHPQQQTIFRFAFRCVSVYLIPGWWLSVMTKSSPKCSHPSGSSPFLSFPQINLDKECPQVSLITNQKAKNHEILTVSDSTRIAELPATWSATGGIVWSGFHIQTLISPTVQTNAALLGASPSFPCLVWRQSGPQTSHRQ